MIDEEVRRVLLAGEGIQYHITMEERAKLHILPDQLRWIFQCAMVKYAEQEMYRAMFDNEEDFEKWQRIYYQRGAC